MKNPVSPGLLKKMDAYWRAANYLSVGQIYLLDNPLLKKPLRLEQIKPRLLGHWGTTPGLNFIYVHLNRLIKERGLNIIFITGPGHGGPSLTANTYLEGAYGRYYPDVTSGEEGMRRLFKQFSFPGGVSSHTGPETPGSIHEGGELGYSLSHAYGAVFDNPGLIAACVVGDGEAETGPLAAAWHSNKFLNPGRDGAVLPILHLNGYKIANPSIFARISRDELENYFKGCGYRVIFVEGKEPFPMHKKMAAALDEAADEIKSIQENAQAEKKTERPFWPMIILRSPKGWTGPEKVDGKLTEGSWRSHQVPLSDMAAKPERVKQLEKWMKSYKPEELFDSEGRLLPELAELAPRAGLRMGENPHANGGSLMRALRMPDFRKYAVKVARPGAAESEATKVLGVFLRDVMEMNPSNFRLFGPDETASNRLDAVYEASKKTWLGSYLPEDKDGGELSPSGRVMEILSEHTCQGWLEGYLLTGRHGLFATYEAFAHVVDSMFNQHAKWLDATKNRVHWRAPLSSLNILLSSHVWRQDHNGFSHQDPGFIDLAANKKAEIVRIYLPPDANTLLSVADHCLRSRHYINVIIAGKQKQQQWLDMDSAVKHCTAGLGIWPWAGSDRGGEPDVVMACSGDIPTLETLAAVSILRKSLPEVKVRVINVVNLMKLQSPKTHPHGLGDMDFDALFTKDKPVIFNFHGYPWLLHRLTYARTNHNNLHARGFTEEGTTTTPFDMAVMNGIDRFSLVSDVIDRTPGLGSSAAYLKQELREKLLEHKHYIAEYGQEMPEVRNWEWEHGRT